MAVADEADKKKEDTDSDQDEFEINSGVEFDGNCLEPMLTFRVDDIEVSSRDVIVAEIKDRSLNNYSFKYKPVKILGYGQCQYCYSHKPLTCQCKCKEVKYCTEECMKKDEKFHLDKCKNAYQVDKDFKMSKKTNA